MTFDVPAGEFVAIVGPSGCGKSTLLSLLTGLDQPTNGEVRVLGRRPSQDQRHVAYMPQRDLLLPWLSVLDNVTLGLEVQGTTRSAARREALVLFERFGLSGFEQAYPDVLSGGMRQRAALLRTVLVRRPVLALDEPFGALDALTRSDMQTWLLGIWDEFHATTLLVTHDVDEAILLADRVYLMSPRPGCIIDDLSVDFIRPRSPDLITDPSFVDLKRRVLASLRTAREHSEIRRG